MFDICGLQLIVNEFSRNRCWRIKGKLFLAKLIAVRIIDRRAVCLEASVIADLDNIRLNNWIGPTHYQNSR